MQEKDTKVSVPSECAVIDVLARADVLSHRILRAAVRGVGCVCV